MKPLTLLSALVLTSDFLRFILISDPISQSILDKAGGVNHLKQKHKKKTSISKVDFWVCANFLKKQTTSHRPQSGTATPVVTEIKAA